MHLTPISPGHCRDAEGFAPRPDAHPHHVDIAARLPASASSIVLRTLVEAGVDTFFGIPGGPVAQVFHELDEIPGARLVESRQETAAAFAAAGYHRSTGRVAGVIVTAGPGATQVVTGTINAHLERVPLVVIVGDVSWAATGRRLVQDTGPEGVAIEHVLGRATRMQVRIARPESAAAQTLAAIEAARDPERPGPVLIVVPMHIGAGLTVAPRLSHRRQRPRFTVDPRVVEEASATLLSAERPLLVIGAGCRASASAVGALVDALDVPFVTTPAAKGLVSEDHPRSLRNAGTAASQWARAYTAAGVDGCLVLGTDLDDAAIGQTRYVAAGGRMVHVDLDARVFNRNLETSLGVVTEVGGLAAALTAHWQRHGLQHGRALGVVQRLKEETPAYDCPSFACDTAEPVAPHRAIADLQAALPHARFVSDIGQHMLFALHYVKARGPQAFHIQLSLGSMGSGIAGAIGQAVGVPGHPVVCICGDGGMQMMGAEALVAVRERLPILYAVFNDGRYNIVHHGMKQQFGRARAWDTHPIDFVRWAEALGMRAARIERPGEISGAAIHALLGGGGPALLDIRIDREVQIKAAGRVEALQLMSQDAGAPRGLR